MLCPYDWERKYKSVTYILLIIASIFACPAYTYGEVLCGLGVDFWGKMGEKG